MNPDKLCNTLLEIIDFPEKRCTKHPKTVILQLEGRGLFVPLPLGTKDSDWRRRYIMTARSMPKIDIRIPTLGGNIHAYTLTDAAEENGQVLMHYKLIVEVRNIENIDEKMASGIYWTVFSIIKSILAIIE